MKPIPSYFKSSIIVAILGLFFAFTIGHYYTHTTAGALAALVITAILGVLEISLSFDNAVVNALVLKKMSPNWQHRFLTWGMIIAVFGMRLIFPLLIVGVVAKLNPLETLTLAAIHPEDYARIMLSAHHEVSSFGGSFLMLVALKYFFNHEKNNHWIRVIERPLAKMGRLEAIEVGIVLIILYALSRLVKSDETLSVLYSGLAGVLTFLVVEGIGTFLHAPKNTTVNIAKASLSMFIYLEVLDASFSFDGVVGAFAITNSLFLITIGLSIGAMLLRSLTIMMVEHGTLEAFQYLENGAFYAVAALATIMFVNTVHEIPEVITGLIGAAFITLSIISSRKKRFKNKK